MLLLSNGEYQVRKIAPNAFQGEKGLETVILPESMAYAKEHDNITFEVIDVENDDYYPYEEAIYFTRNYRMVEDKLSMSTKEDGVLYPAVASPCYSNSDIEYTSSNNKIAVIKDGIITGKKAGTVTITASLPNGVEKSIEVTVEGEEKEDIFDEDEGSFDDFVGDEAIVPDKVEQQSEQKNSSKTSKTNIKPELSF